MSIKRDLVAYFKYRGAGYGEEYAIHCSNGELVHTSDEHPLSVLRRLRELRKEGTIDYWYEGRNVYKIWLLNGQDGGEKEAITHTSAGASSPFSPAGDSPPPDTQGQMRFEYGNS